MTVVKVSVSITTSINFGAMKKEESRTNNDILTFLQFELCKYESWIY